MSIWESQEFSVITWKTVPAPGTNRYGIELKKLCKNSSSPPSPSPVWAICLFNLSSTSLLCVLYNPPIYSVWSFKTGNPKTDKNPKSLYSSYWFVNKLSIATNLPLLSLLIKVSLYLL